MMSNRSFTFLCCLFGLLVSAARTQSLTQNPECDGMNRAKTSLEKGIGTFTKGPAKCLVNNACTGLSCHGTNKSQPFYMSLKLQHCMRPDPEIKIGLTYPKRRFKVLTTLKPYSTVVLYKMSKYRKLKLKLNLKRKQNRITTSIILMTCFKYGGWGPTVCKQFRTLLKPTTFCVDMNTCPKGQFNTTGYAPCKVTPAVILN